MTQTEALKLALEALENLEEHLPFDWAFDELKSLAGQNDYRENVAQVRSLIPILKDALLSRSDGEAKDEPCCYGGIAHDCHAGSGCQIAERLKTVPKANEFNPDWDTQAVLTEEIQRMAKRIEELEAQTRSVDKDEPVAWMDASRFEELRNGFTVMTTLTKKKAFFDDIAIYTTPPQRTWVSMTNEQYLEACKIAEGGNYMVAFQRIQQWLMENNA